MEVGVGVMGTGTARLALGWAWRFEIVAFVMMELGR